MDIYREITPLKNQDVLVVLDSTNNGFDYPIHNHPEYELNLVMGMSGTRIVGDSTQRYQDFDLVLLGPYLYHKWDGDQSLQEQGPPYRVITIQFAMDLFGSHLFQKDRFLSIRNLLTDARRGIKFHGECLKEAMRLMIELTEDQGFTNIINFLQLLDLLSHAKEAAFLASEGFSPQALRNSTNRIQLAYSYILQHFKDPSLRLDEVSNKLNMSPSAFSHFFRKFAFRSFSQFLIDLRIGHACKLLLDTDNTVSQISAKSGFNNLTNFNRLFKKYRDCTPIAYRKRYLEKTAFDWTKQSTPWQFMPKDTRKGVHDNPTEYATRLKHY
ncbi:MAG: AraC family transcriptional regulator [Lewinella sp.]|jgi:AraC-like DNA-binding protein|uniref:helix-turn-helix transcriptional regulator n=1 Tax=Lewinella sp. TaxID=2004506 RepID=UPI003D6B808D